MGMELRQGPDVRPGALLLYQYAIPRRLHSGSCDGRQSASGMNSLLCDMYQSHDI
jgi:hypothetical protein